METPCGLRCRRCGTEFQSPAIYEPDPEETIAYCSWECADGIHR